MECGQRGEFGGLGCIHVYCKIKCCGVGMMGLLVSLMGTIVYRLTDVCTLLLGNPNFKVSYLST